MHVKRYIAWTAALGLALAGVITTSSALAQDNKGAETKKQESKGRVRVYRNSGAPIEGTLVDKGDSYEIVNKGITVTIPKTQVRKIEPLDQKPDAGGPAEPGERVAITQAMIAEILGSENIEATSLDAEDALEEDVLGDLPVNEGSVRQMFLIAGPKAKRLETPHFVFVYTSSLDLARTMAGNLERVYRWCATFNDLMGIHSVRPKHKLETYFFGTYKEYEAYQAYTGMMSMGIIGFYIPDAPGSNGANRSAFFDMDTWPPVAQRYEQLKQPGIDPQAKRRITNEIKRWRAHLNQEVVQHEAAHHIHFNIGTFSTLQGIPRWSVEGLAQMFETVESDVGASLGAINHNRLMEFRRIFGENGERIGDMRVILLNDGWWFNNMGAAYPMGWALNHYLYKKHRDKYKLWMQYLAQPFDYIPTITERQREFERLFGDINEEWTKAFVEYMKTIHLDTSVLPPDLP